MRTTPWKGSQRVLWSKPRRGSPTCTLCEPLDLSSLLASESKDPVQSESQIPSCCSKEHTWHPALEELHEYRCIDHPKFAMERASITARTSPNTIRATHGRGPAQRSHRPVASHAENSSLVVTKVISIPTESVERWWTWR